MRKEREKNESLKKIVSAVCRLIGLRYSDSRDNRDKTFSQAEMTHKEFECFYKVLFTRMPNPSAIISPEYDDEGKVADLRFIDVNPAYEICTGKTRAQLIGKVFSEVYGSRNRYLKEFEHLLRTGEPLQFLARHPGGDDRHDIISMFLIGKNQIALLFQNISDRIKMENDLKVISANLTSIIESTDDLIWSVDSNYRIIYYNTALKRYVEKNNNTLIKPGMHLSELAADDRAKVWAQFYRRAAREGRFSIDVPLDSRQECYQVAVNPIYKDGEICAISIFSKNISERIRLQDEIIHLNAELEQRIKERTAELQDALSELESFTYTVSHDLKSPLRAIEAYSRLLYEDYPYFRVDGNIEEALLNITSISNDMIALINKLLLYSTADRLDISIEEVDLNQMLRTIFDELAKSSKDRRISLVLEDELPIMLADKILMKQVLTNILSNSIKFSKTRQYAEISVRHEITENEVVIIIGDNGIGFEPASAEQLFKIFHRLHSGSEYEGTGIGLATVSKLVSRHGGRVWIEGEKDKGATVFLAFPPTNYMI